MAAYIVLDDGRMLWRSNLAIDGVLHMIADQLPEENHDLKAWLKDKGSRPAPFIDFDIRGLSIAHRAAFYEAARKAMEDLCRLDARVIEESPTSEALNALLRMKQSIDKGEPPLSLSDNGKVRPFDGRQIDLSELWELESNSDGEAPEGRGGKSIPSKLSVAARIGLLLLPPAAITVGMFIGWWCFGRASVSFLEFSCVVCLVLAIAGGVTALILFLQRRAESVVGANRPRG